MSAYPELPAIHEGNTQQHAPDSQIAAGPEIPSVALPWLVGVIATGALALQVIGLVKLLGFNETKAQFEANVSAWDASNANRQETVNEWKKLEDESRQRTEAARERAVALQGSAVALQTQHDDLTESVALQTKSLEILKSSEADLEKQLDIAKAAAANRESEKQRLDSLISAAMAESEQLAASNKASIEKERVVRDALARILESQKSAEQELESKTRLVVVAEQKLKDIEAQLTKLDVMVVDRIKIAAQLQLQQETVKKLTAENAKARSDLQDIRASITKSEAEFEGATSRSEELETKLSKLAVTEKDKVAEIALLTEEIGTTEARVTAQRKLEQELAVRVVDSTKTLQQVSKEATTSLSAITQSAAKAISDMAEQAAQVRTAIESLRAISDKKQTEPDAIGEPGRND